MRTLDAIRAFVRLVVGNIGYRLVEWAERPQADTVDIAQALARSRIVQREQD